MSEQKKGGEEKESKRKDNHFPSIKILTRINFGITGIKLHLAAQLKRSPIKDGKSWGKKLSLCVCVCDRKTERFPLRFYLSYALLSQGNWMKNEKMFFWGPDTVR